LHHSKPVAGRGGPSQSQIYKLQNDYGLGGRRNVNNLEVRKRAVWAVFCHKLSQNERPQHGVCPSGDDSWCDCKNGASAGVAHEHEYYLPAAVVDAIKPVFRDLAGAALLNRVLHRKTQNPNEVFDSVIWTKTTKTVFVRLDKSSRGCMMQCCVLLVVSQVYSEARGKEESGQASAQRKDGGMTWRRKTTYHLAKRWNRHKGEEQSV
jgi:hypothetical protein